MARREVKILSGWYSFIAFLLFYGIMMLLWGGYLLIIGMVVI